MSLGGRRKPSAAHLVGRPVAVRQHGGKALDSARDLVSQNRMCQSGLSRSWDTKFGRITFSHARVPAEPVPVNRQVSPAAVAGVLGW